jgi:diadenosine tetraphosphate (Ap4A) HIT family hydrolase
MYYTASRSAAWLVPIGIARRSCPANSWSSGVFEDERVLAFHHPQPSAAPHVVVIPKAHVASLLAPEALDGDLLVSMLTAVQVAAATIGVDSAPGFYVRANAAAPGVTPHMHWHVLPGAATDWPSLDDGHA